MQSTIGARDPSACAKGNTVVAVPIAPHAVAAVLPLAESAATFGFPCIVVLPFEQLRLPGGQSQTARVLALPPPDPPLLPRGFWCNKPAADYTRRRLQYHRMRLWHVLLERGLDVLGIDSGMRLRRDPLPAIGAMRTREDEQYGKGVRPDVLGGTPGWFLKEFYLHTLWIRSTPTTRALLALSLIHI